MWLAQTTPAVVAGVVAVVVGGIAAATGASTSDVTLRSGVTPWAFAALVAGVGLILLGSYRCNIGRPALLVRWGSRLAFLGLGCAAAFLCVTGILNVVDSDLLSTGDTLVSSLGTLAASVCTLLILPIGLLTLGVAVLADTELPRGARGLPLAGTLVFLLGPVLVAVLPESNERPVFVAWPVLLGAVWATYGLIVTRRLGRQSPSPQAGAATGARAGGAARAS